MILDEITLHNFGVYRERQTINLAPPSSDQPIILLGGLNGGGKTTLLDALQLALYGKQARCSNRNGLSYEDFLRRCINRSVDPADGAAIELQFRRRTDAHEHTYRVHRSWSANGSGLRERLEVLQDGELDSVITDSWSERVHEFLPARLSQLFFFDGDRIEALADFESSSELLASAIHSLLGLDHVDHLSRDLLVLERKQRTALKSKAERDEIDQLRRSIDQLERRRRQLVEQRASAQNEDDLWVKRSRETDNQFRLEGGELLHRREQLEAERALKTSELETVEESLRDLAGRALPLLLIESLMTAVQEQSQVEVRAAQSREVVDLLTKRDESLLGVLRSGRASAKTTDLVGRFLAMDRAEREGNAQAHSYLGLTDRGLETLHATRSESRGDLQAVRRLAETSDKLAADIINIDRHLAGVPDTARIEHILKEHETMRLRLAESRARLAAMDAELERMNRELEQKQARLVSYLEGAVEHDFQQEDAARIINHSHRSRTTLARFREAVVVRHVARIQSLVFDSFTTLLRKRSLIASLVIDPKAFTLELRDRDRLVVLPERLSAGERQLLAVSLLWGLARASGHALPAIIDTPLGRLDTVHRGNLVERYFPHASHQVVLLSTDEEIDEHHYETLKPWIGRAYRLEYDDRRGSTEVQSGYFW